MQVKHSDTDKIKAPEGQGCPKCGGYVYHADQIHSKGFVYHKECFKCFACHRVLDSRIANDGPDKRIYCNGEEEEEIDGGKTGGKKLTFLCRL